MKRLLLFLLPVMLLMYACKKDKSEPGIPAGIWVDQARPQDTIITYREGNRNVLFDKSQQYRESRPRLTSDDPYKWIYYLEPGKIRIKMYQQHEEDYAAWDFQWTETGREFSLTANSIRLYLSSIGTKLVYRKVQ